MVQDRGALGFALEASESPRIACRAIRQELEGHGVTECNLLGPINDPHLATGNLVNNAVPRDGLPSHWKGSPPARPSYVPSYGKSMCWRSGRRLQIRRSSVGSRKFAESLTAVDFARRAKPQGLKPWIQRLGYGAARSRALSKPLQLCRELTGHHTRAQH